MPSEEDNPSLSGPMKQMLLIRGLVLASLALLLIGAVAPLLTIERFYFLSNSFSLLSGMQQLVANNQFLIAAIIALFSLCVPVTKGAVIWIAAYPGSHRGSLLAIADRFGKWSMLEVFVAALLIIALKLGPVVDTTLHYGAWLLASSVLLSGIASQLLAHEPSEKTVFSNPVTLTIGAVGGAVSATLLIGLLNPGLFNFAALVGTPESRCIQRVLRLDDLYARANAEQSDYLVSLRSIETDNCPEEFSDAFGDYIEAWENLDATEENADTEPSLLDRASALIGLTVTREDALEEIEESWQELERIALDFGVSAPPK